MHALITFFHLPHCFVVFQPPVHFCRAWIGRVSRCSFWGLCYFVVVVVNNRLCCFPSSKSVNQTNVSLPHLPYWLTCHSPGPTSLYKTFWIVIRTHAFLLLAFDAFNQMLCIYIIIQYNFQQRISWFSHRWRTQRNAISNVNCRIQWIIESLNAPCAPWFSKEHACLSVIKLSTLSCFCG